MTFTHAQSLDTVVEDVELTFEMDEEAFRAFYDRTARPLWSYLSRMTGESQAADDLLQETYYRFLRARVGWENEAHRRAYLFRIATNLVRDRHRRARFGVLVSLPDPERDLRVAAAGDLAESTLQRTDLRRAMSRLRPRERALLWLAYAQGHAHTEIADVLGVKTASVKLLLFRARRKLAGLLRRAETTPDGGQAL